MIKILNIVGARPNFMKIAPIIHAIEAQEGMSQCLVHTGQHYDEKLSKVFFDELGIPRADINLGVGSAPRLEQIEEIMERFEPVLLEQKPQLVLVVGDVNSTIACARVAKKHGVKVAHVEAGLRSFDMDMPEELNRIETDQISDYLFITEQSGIDNLAKEEIPGKAVLIGNVMIDTLISNLKKAESSDILERLALSPGSYFASTFHRPSNVDSKEDLSKLVGTIVQLCERLPLVLPLHPRTEASLKRHGLDEEFRATKNLILCEPLGYLDFLALIRNAKAVVTDSGGIQEETTYLRVPCITMRENTERPITLTLGTNALVGSDRDLLFTEVDKVLDASETKGSIPELWDGKTAERIIAYIKNEFS